MKSYGDDGSNTEGITYWQYGFWMYLNFADMRDMKTEILVYRHIKTYVEKMQWISWGKF